MIRSGLESILPMVDPAATAPSLAASFLSGNVADNGDGTYAVAKGNLSLSANSDYVLHVLEALDGANKGQKALVLATVSGTGFTTTPFRTATTATNFRLWQLPWPAAVATSNGDTTTVNASGRAGQADDYFNGDYLLGLYGANEGELVAISDFVSSGGVFTTAAMGASSVLGDAYLVVSRSMLLRDHQMSIPGGKPIERQLMVSGLDDVGGIIVGAAEAPTVTLTAEIRGLNTAAGNGTAASRPAEIGRLLAAVMEEVLVTGDAITGGTATAPQVDAASGWAADTIAMVNQYAFGVTAVTAGTPAGNSTLTVPAGHLPAAPTAGNVVYGAACYQPVDTGHLTASFLRILDAEQLAVVTGALPAIKGSIPQNELLTLELAYQGADGFYTALAKAHTDDYDTAQPIPGKSNISRLVLDGTAFTGDVMSTSFELYNEPVQRSRSFGVGAENRGGLVYQQRRMAGITFKVRMSDTEWLARYQRGATMDLLVQVGVVPTCTFALWATRSQLVAPPVPTPADGFYEFDLQFRFLQPLDETRPAFVLSVL